MPKIPFSKRWPAKPLSLEVAVSWLAGIIVLVSFFSCHQELLAETTSITYSVSNLSSSNPKTITVQSESPVSAPVYVIPVKGIIDLGLSGFIKRSLQEAKENHARAVIFEIDTFGGRVDAATDICRYIEDSPDIPKIAFIDDQAWSAGALIALACQRIIMSEGSSIGSAEPRISTGFNPEQTDEKTVSAISAKFRAVAEQNGHSPNLAAAMVDKDIILKKVKIDEQIFILTPEEIESKKSELGEENVTILSTITEKGKLLNLSAQEAKKLNLASDIFSSRQAILKSMNWPEEAVVETSMSWSEVFVRFLTHPVVSSMLLTLGFLGLIFELRLPGWGIGGTLGLLFLALFFWGHYLVGLANWGELILFLAGVVLLLLEIFVIPGFGIAGILGIILLVASLFLALVKHPFHTPKPELMSAAYIISVALMATFVAAILLFRFIPHTSIFRKLILASEESKSKGYQIGEDKWKQYLNRTGRTLTLLRPAGRAVFGDEIVDVVTEGEFIDKDKLVRVIEIKGNHIVVTQVNSSQG